MSVLSQLQQFYANQKEAICSLENQTSTLFALPKDGEAKEKQAQAAQAGFLSAIAISSSDTSQQQITVCEESNSFKIELTILLVQDKLPGTFHNKIFASIEDYKQQQLNSGHFCVKLLADNDVLMKFQIFFSKNDFSSCKLNKTILPGVRLLSPHVAFKEFMVALPQRIETKSTLNNSQSLAIESFTHQFIFDKIHDSFQVSLRIENPQRIVNYQGFFHFGQFEKISSLQSGFKSTAAATTHKSQVIQQMLQQWNLKESSSDNKLSYLKQEDLQVDEELVPQGSELSSTKSNNFITSPLMLPLNQDLRFSPILRLKFESSNSNEDIKFDQINENDSDIEQQDEDNPMKTKEQQRQSQQSGLLLMRTKKFDKKNVVKNFVKAFDSYFLDGQRDQELMSALGITLEKLNDLRQLINQIEKQLKYNNKMIIQIVNSELNSVFRLFLNTQALLWINNSSVFDKSAHRTILKDYITAADNPAELHKIVNLRVRNRMPTKK